MHISVFGLGYVGTVMSACLAAAGHTVLGVDIDKERVAMIARGEAPIVEPGLRAMLARAHTEGRLSACTDPQRAIAHGALSFICVGTPADASGRLDTSIVEAVVGQIGDALRQHPQAPTHTVVLRSTVSPGTARRCIEILATRSGRAPHDGVRLLIQPEFLREGAAIADFEHPPFTLVGTPNPLWAEALRPLYAHLSAPFVVSGLDEAELLKTVCNAWHATKVVFANEVGRMCHDLDVDASEVMGLFTRDTQLNLSARYLRPGFAYGGSCLPKDLSALHQLARDRQLDLPLLGAIAQSNRVHIDAARRAIADSGARSVGFLGLAFKPLTDDLRGSPLVELVEYALSLGLRVAVHDPHVDVERLVGSNRRFALARLGPIAELMVPTHDALASMDLLVLGHGTAPFVRFCEGLPDGTPILDLCAALDPERDGVMRIV